MIRHFETSVLLTNKHINGNYVAVFVYPKDHVDEGVILTTPVPLTRIRQLIRYMAKAYEDKDTYVIDEWGMTRFTLDLTLPRNVISDIPLGFRRMFIDHRNKEIRAVPVLTSKEAFGTRLRTKLQQQCHRRVHRIECLPTLVLFHRGPNEGLL